jgi:hypothetical protein
LPTIKHACVTVAGNVTARAIVLGMPRHAQCRARSWREYLGIIADPAPAPAAAFG